MKKDGLTAKTIQLIAHLNQHKINTLAEISSSLAIPKPTLHRLLSELIDLQLVIKHPDTHFYSVTFHCEQLSRGVNQELTFIEAATPVARTLTQTCEWPIAVATYDEGEMLIRFSSRPDARFSFIKSTVGKRFPLFGSALGEAWMSQKGTRVQQQQLNQLDPLAVQRRLRQVKFNTPQQYLEQLKHNGYALRYGRTGESSHLAIPICKGRQVLGSIGISVFTSAVGEEIIPLYLEKLLVAAEKIVDSL